MAAELTHGLVVSAAGNATVVEALIGSIELPTRGNPWALHDLNAQVVRQTATAAEMVGGRFGIDSASGDMDPDPAPSNFPVFESASFLGATEPVSTCPLFNYRMNLKAAGKANLNLNYTQAIAATAAPLVNIGVNFGPNIPQMQPFKFCDRVRAAQAAAANTQIGTIQLSEKATKITGIMGVLKQDGVLTTAEELTGIFSLRSDDVDLVPSFWLFNEVHGAGLGALIGSGYSTAPKPHIVDIPVPGGARIDCFVDLLTALTNPADVEIFLFYE